MEGANVNMIFSLLHVAVFHC